jgi:hypothetical protein
MPTVPTPGKSPAPGCSLDDAEDEADNHLDETLPAAGHFLEIAGDQPAGKQDQSHDDEHRQHRIGDRDRPDVEEDFGGDFDVNFHVECFALLLLLRLPLLAQALRPCNPARHRTNSPRLRAQLGKLPQLITGQEQAEPNSDQGE